MFTAAETLTWAMGRPTRLASAHSSSRMRSTASPEPSLARSSLRTVRMVGARTACAGNLAAGTRLSRRAPTLVAPTALLVRRALVFGADFVFFDRFLGFPIRLDLAWIGFHAFRRH